MTNDQFSLKMNDFQSAWTTLLQFNLFIFKADTDSRVKKDALFNNQTNQTNQSASWKN